MYIDTLALFDEFPSDDDDDGAPALTDMTDVIRSTSDRLALPALAELLRHPHSAVREAAVEALGTLRPSALELRRQLTPVALARVRSVLGYERTRVTRKARRTLDVSAVRDRSDEDDDGDDDRRLRSTAS